MFLLLSGQTFLPLGSRQAQMKPKLKQRSSFTPYHHWYKIDPLDLCLFESRLKSQNDQETSVMIEVKG